MFEESRGEARTTSFVISLVSIVDDHCSFSTQLLSASSYPVLFGM